ncbi:MAG TPA: hypothetical protein VLR94_09060 [Acidobacteriota bacterium]|nr:hypothetical protein [Acidobacteriota bacterium]
MKKQAVEYYHSLLTDSVAAETSGLMESLLKERKLFFGGRPLCVVLRPHFYTADQFQYLKRETEVILGAFYKTHQVCMKDAAIRAFFHLEPWEEEIIHVDRHAPVPWSTSRLDSFYSLDHNTLSFIEYNAETPAGMAYEDVQAEAFLDLPVMKKFQERYAVRPLPVRSHLLDSILQTYADWLGSAPAEKPQIAIADWEDVPTKNEHRLCLEWFEKHGVRTRLVDPHEMEYRNRKLWAGDFRVDVIYKRVLAQELVQRMGTNNPIFLALRDRAVCMSNSFQAVLLYKKCSLAFLSDEANHHLFTGEEIRAIGEHIPWTRVVQDRDTYYNDRTIDLLTFIEQNRERLVLKPNDSYGGKGVLLGWDTSTEAWRNGIRQALNEPYVVQEKVNVAAELFPFFTSGRMELQRLYVDADPFIFMGRTVHGVLTRLSSAALLNVTAGHGSAVPSFVVGTK